MQAAMTIMRMGAMDVLIRGEEEIARVDKLGFVKVGRIAAYTGIATYDPGIVEVDAKAADVEAARRREMAAEQGMVEERRAEAVANADVAELLEEMAQQQEEMAEMRAAIAALTADDDNEGDGDSTPASD